MDRQYTNEITNINGTGNVDADGCNCIVFYNPPGNTGNMLVNDMPITPGCQFMLSGHPGEADKTKYNVVLPNATEKFYVIRKYYKK